MTAPRAEKIPVNLPGVERKNIPNSIQVYRESRAKIRYPEKSEEVNAAANEDASVISWDKRAFGVFDGMGGEAGGQEASNSAREYLANSLNTFPEKQSLEQETQLIHDILIDANKKILREKMGQSEGRNTTASVVRIWKGPGGELKAIVGNIGDSRIYLCRGNELAHITLDDSLIRKENATESEDEIRKRQIKLSNVSSREDFEKLSPYEQYAYENRNQIRQYLGYGDGIQPRMKVINLLPGDKLVICSDGVPDNLVDDDIKDEVKKGGNIAERLVSKAVDRSRSAHFRAKKDDMTAIVVGIPLVPVYSKGQRENSSMEKQKNNVGWKKGMLSPVRRSNGNIEYWPIDWIESDGKQAIVSKQEPNGKKRIREVSLDMIPEEVLGNISRAKSEAQLYYSLERLGGIQGSQEFFSSERMIDILKAFFSDGAPVDGITELHGLRQIAIKLKDKIKKLDVRKRIEQI